MDIRTEKARFDASLPDTASSVLLVFEGVDGYDVYNCSTPFHLNGEHLLLGRVEARTRFMASRIMVFRASGADTWQRIPDAPVWDLEDPFITFIKGELVMGGTFVEQKNGELLSYRIRFFRGTDIRRMTLFAEGPAMMKDIRLVELEDGLIGVFSRPKNEAVIQKYGSASMIGFTVIDSLEDLTADVIENAPVIEDLFAPGEWGGCNQVCRISGGRLGIIGHYSYEENGSTDPLAVYCNIAFEFDPYDRSVSNLQVIGTRKSYPACTPKQPRLADCAFTSGIILRPDGLCDLYSGVGDTHEGRTVIPCPFTF